jgi:hypothetical protein
MGLISKLPTIGLLVPAALVVTWMAGAIYYDVGRASRLGVVLAMVGVVAMAVMFALWQPVWKPAALLGVVLLLFLIWWLSGVRKVIECAAGRWYPVTRVGAVCL